MLKSQIDEDRILHAFTSSSVDDLRASFEDPKTFFKHTRHRMMLFTEDMPHTVRRSLLAHTIVNFLSFFKIVTYNHETELVVKVPIIDLLGDCENNAMIVDDALTFKIKKKKNKATSAKKRNDFANHLPLSMAHSMTSILKFTNLDDPCLEKTKDVIYQENQDVITHIRTILGEDRCSSLDMVLVFMIGLLFIKKQFNLTKKLMGFKLPNPHTKPTYQCIATICEYPSQTIQFLHAILLDDGFLDRYTRSIGQFSITIDVCVDKTIASTMSSNTRDFCTIIAEMFTIDTKEVAGRVVLFALIHTICRTMKQEQLVRFIYGIQVRSRYYPFKLIDVSTQAVLLNYK